MRERLAPLSIPGFGTLAGAYTLSELGNWLGEIALAVLVFEETGSALAATALFLAMQFVPAFLALALVARVEPAGSRVVLPVLYAAEGLVFLVLAGVSANFVLAAVVLLATIDGTLAIAGRAFTRTAIFDLLEPSGRLREGNAIVNIGFTAAGAVGPALAGLVVAAWGVQVALLLDAGTFLAASLALVVARSLPNVKAQPSPWTARLREGIAYVAGRRVLGRLMALSGLAMIFMTAVIPIEIVFVKDTLGGGSAEYGIFLAAWGVGMLAGGLAFAGASRISLQRLLAMSALSVGLSYLALAASPTLALACAAAVLGGAGNGAGWVALISSVQRLTATSYQARAVGLLESISWAAPGLGFTLGGLTAELASARTSFAVAGLGTLAVLVLAALALRGPTWTKEEAAVQQGPQAAEAPAHGARA